MKKQQTLSDDDIKEQFSKASVKDLERDFENLQARDRRHRDGSRSRRWAEGLHRCVSDLIKPQGFVDVVQTLAGASEVAALTVGGLKAILMFASLRGSSYTLLSERTQHLVSLFTSVAVYAGIRNLTSDLEKCLDDVLHELSRFYQLADSTYKKGSSRLRVFDFLFKPYADVFAEINQNIEDALLRLHSVAQAQTLANSSELLVLKKEDVVRKDKQEIQMCIESLHDTNVDNIWDRCYEKRVTGTCEWIFRDETRIRDWYDDPALQYLLITGQTGCGKTTVAACVVKKLQEDISTEASDTKPSTLVCSYTTDQDTSTRDDASTTTRAFLFQAFNQREKLTSIAMTTSGGHGRCRSLSLSQLWNIMLMVIHNTRPDRVYIIIDGLDKFDLEPLNDLIPRLNSLQGQPNVKLLVTSSDSNLHKFELPELTKQFDISEKTGQDLSLIVSGAFARLPRSELSREQEQSLTETIVERAGSSTLWATMILDTLFSSSGRSVADIRGLIKATPRKLEELYFQRLDRIEPRECALAARVLHILMGTGSLTVEGLRHAFVSDRVYETPEALETACDRISSSSVYLKGLLGVLILVEEDRIRLAHSSVGEYLQDLAVDTKKGTGDDWHLVPPRIARAFGCSAERNVTLMAEISVNYLRTCDLCGLVNDHTNIPVEKWEFASMCVDSGEPERTTAPPAPTESAVFSVRHPAPLFGWAAVNWAKFVSQLGAWSLAMDHIMMAEGMLETIIALSDRQSGASCRWAQYCVEGEIVQAPDEETFHLADISPLVVAARFDMVPVLSFILRKRCANLSISEYKNALVFSSRHPVGHCLPLLLNHMHTAFALLGGVTEADLEACMDAALFAAAEAGKDCNVSILLEAKPGIDVSRIFARDHSPLSIAISRNHVRTAKRLLGVEGLDKAKLQNIILVIEFSPTLPGLEGLDIDDVEKTGAEDHQDLCGSLTMELDTLRALLQDERIDISARDKRGRSLLSYAAERGRRDVVNLLLTSSGPSRATQVKSLLEDTGDNEGKTPMWYSSWNNHMPILERLCKDDDMTCQVEKSSVQDGTTALSAAARRGHAEVIRFLGSEWPEELNTRDSCNGTLLSATTMAEDEQGAATARVLLSLGAKSTIDVESDSGTTPLEYAVKSSRFKLMEVLVLEGGANTDRILTKDAPGHERLLIQPVAGWDIEEVQKEMKRLVQLQRKLKRGTDTLHGVAKSVLQRSAFARAFAP